MTTHKGFAAVTALIVVLGLLVLGGAGYVALNPKVLQAPADDGAGTEEGERSGEEAGEGAKTSISWKFESMGEVEHVPYTRVLLTLNGKVQDLGGFQGSCSEIGATGGVDGKGLLAGELSAVQCWFAGGGDEIGVFANEDGGYDVLVGKLEEPIEGGAGFRGDFKAKLTF